jgi:hypothetical protein
MQKSERKVMNKREMAAYSSFCTLTSDFSPSCPSLLISCFVFTTIAPLEIAHSNPNLKSNHRVGAALDVDCIDKAYVP